MIIKPLIRDSFVPAAWRSLHLRFLTNLVDGVITIIIIYIYIFFFFQKKKRRRNEDILCMDYTNKLTMLNLFVCCDNANFTFFVGIGVIQGCLVIFSSQVIIQVHLELAIQI